MKIDKKDIIWSYFAQIFQVGASFFLLPAVLKLLNQEEIAIWYIFQTITSLVNLLDFGFQPTISRNVAFIFSGAKNLSKEKITNMEYSDSVNYYLLYKLIITIKEVYKKVSVIALIAMGIIGTPYLYSVVEKNMSINNIFIAWSILIVSSSINLYFTYYTPLLQGQGKIKEVNISIIISKLTLIIVTYIGLLNHLNLVAVSLGVFCGMIVNRIITHYFLYTNVFKVNIDEFRKNKISKMEYKEIKEVVWYNSKKSGIISIFSFLLFQSNMLIASKFLPLKIIACYGLSLQVVKLLSSLSTLLINTLTPKLSSFRIKNSKNELKEFYGVILIAFFFIYIIGSVFIVLLANPMLILIKSNTLLIDIKIFIFLLFVYFLESHHVIASTMITTGNEIPFVKVAVYSGFSVVVLSYLSLRYTSLGITGIIFVQFIVQLSCNNWKWPLLVLKDLNTNYSELMKLGNKSILKRLKMIHNR